jgi:hypothetical protein
MTTKKSLKRKLANVDGVKAGRLFKKTIYVKPVERTAVKGSQLWTTISVLAKGKLVNKHISKWTIGEKEAFIKEMNKYLVIQMFDDDGPKGEIERILADVSSFLVRGNDEEMRVSLDPSYLFLDWTQGGDPRPPNEPFPTLPDFIYPSTFNAADIQAIPGLNHVYFVTSIRVGEYILGWLQGQFPGLRGTVMETPTALIAR